MSTFSLINSYVLVAGRSDSHQTIANGGPNTVYYKTTPDVSASSYDGTITSGADYETASPIWIFSTRAIVSVNAPSPSGATFGSNDLVDLGVLTDDPHNVKLPRYGAVGDGVTDDTAAIQAAIDAANASGGGTVYIPESSGEYMVANLVPKSNVTVTGKGTLKLIAGSTEPIFYWPQPTHDPHVDDDYVTDFTVRGLRMIGEPTVSGPDHPRSAVFIMAGKRCRVEGCYITDCASSAIFFSDSQDIWVTDNYVENVALKPAARNAIDFLTGGFTDSADITDGYVCRGNRVKDVGTGGIVVTNTSDLSHQRATVTDNYVSGAPGFAGIAVEASHSPGAIIANNRIRDCGGGIVCTEAGGIITQPPTRYLVIANNIIDSGTVTAGAGITTDASYLQITGNVITSAAAAVTVASATGRRDVSVTNNICVGTNTVDGASEARISISSVTGLLVNGNRIKENTTHSRMGILLSDVTEATVSANSISNAGEDGIYINDSLNMTVSDNTIFNCAVRGSGGTAGIEISAGITENVKMSNNVILDDGGGGMAWGIILDGASPFPGVTILHNEISGGSSGTIGNITFATVSVYRDESGGKQRLRAQFPSGASQAIATEP